MIEFNIFHTFYSTRTQTVRCCFLVIPTIWHTNSWASVFLPTICHTHSKFDVHRLNCFLSHSLALSNLICMWACFFAHRNFKLTLYDVHSIHACCYYCCCSLLSTRRLFSLLTFHNSSNVNKERRVDEGKKTITVYLLSWIGFSVGLFFRCSRFWLEHFNGFEP